VVVVNPKGGSGKTTVATNLLAAYARAERRTALIDRDRQGSAMRWLKLRGSELPAIHGIAAYLDPPPNVTRSFAMRIPPDTERVVVDTAAALSRHELVDAVRRADKILVPVLPSDIDIHAATRCIGDLLVHARVPRGPQVLGVVANRVKRNTVTYQALMRFLDSLGVPVVAVLRDVQAYLRAARHGQGVADLRASDAGPELRQWRGLMRWIDHDQVPSRGPLRGGDPAESAWPVDIDGVARSLLPLPPWGVPGDADAIRRARQSGGQHHGGDS
jgi:chromosome partitioning protein